MITIIFIVAKIVYSLPISWWWVIAAIGLDSRYTFTTRHEYK